jgi:hypothetical protein
MNELVNRMILTTADREDGCAARTPTTTDDLASPEVARIVEEIIDQGSVPDAFLERRANALVGADTVAAGANDDERACNDRPHSAASTPAGNTRELKAWAHIEATLIHKHLSVVVTTPVSKDPQTGVYIYAEPTKSIEVRLPTDKETECIICEIHTLYGETVTKKQVLVHDARVFT